MQIAIPIYERFTALDAVGPYEVLSRLPGARVTFVAASPGVLLTDNGMLGLHAEAAYEDLPAPDVVVVPGGFGTRALLEDERILAWLRGVHETSTWTTSVCTGSLLLAAAGLLSGLEATTHWSAGDFLERLGARYRPERVVRRGRLWTAAGASAGIDMALGLAAEIAGPEAAQAIQLYVEYDPQPPFDSGTPAKASPRVLDLARAVGLTEQVPGRAGDG